VSKKRKDEPPEHPSHVYITVPVPYEIAEQVADLMARRGLDVQQAINLFLVSLVTSSSRRAAVGLADAMPIGKAKGVPVETLIRLEPSYVAWLCENVETFRLRPDAQDLLRQMLELERS
jgi:hypothetical protein